MDQKPAAPIRAKVGLELRCKSWEAEAALRMLENNIDPDVALVPDELIVYGGSGRAARNWKCYHKIVETLKNLEPDETMLVQSGKAVGVLKTSRQAPRVLIANSNLVPAWSTQDNFDEYDRMGLMMYGQMTAGSWIYIGTQGILQGTYETFAAIAEQKFGGTLKGRFVVTGGLGGMSGAQPLSVTMNEGVALVVESYPDRVSQKVREGYCDRETDNLDIALTWIDEALRTQQPLAVGLVGNCADVLPELVRRNRIPDIVTDQTSAHSLLDYIPSGDLNEVLRLKETDPAEYKRRSLQSIVAHTQAIIEMQNRGAIAFDYGNNLRGQAEKGGLSVRNQNGEFVYPGFVPAYIRPLFCEGKGPFRWAALSGDPEDIRKIDRKILQTFPEDHALARWIRLAGEKVPFIGLPTRVCWLGYGDRAKMGLIINDMVASGELKAPIVIGRDHLDCGSVASPNRETEAMMDGSDAVADWPLLNALSNTACGADWVSLHNGGGVGIGNSTHAGMVIVATGTPEKAEQLQRVLSADPGLGIMRHADAGYDIAKNVARTKGVKIPHLDEQAMSFMPTGGRLEADLLIKNAAQVLTMAGGGIGVIPDGAVAVKDGKILAVGPSSQLVRQCETGATEVIDATGKVVTPGLIDCHTHMIFAGSREDEYEMRLAGRTYLDILEAGGGILNTVGKLREADFDQLVRSGKRWLDLARSLGTTTVEIKSGYGLSYEAERKMLEVIKALRAETDQELVATFLGAHAFPAERRENKEQYVQELVNQMLPDFRDLAEFCDIFLEQSAFDYQQADRILGRAKDLGYGIKLHTNQMNPMGGIDLAIKHQAISVDHLDNVTEAEIMQLAGGNTVAVLLPGASYFLKEGHFAPARRLLDRGVTVAIASDFNPGSSPSLSLPLMMSLAVQQLGLKPEEAWLGTTINAAKALNRGNSIGSLEPNKKANLLIWDMPNYLYPFYHFGHNFVERVIV